MAGPEEFAEMKTWIQYGPSDGARLQQALPVIEPDIQRIVDRFYDEVQAHEGSNAVLEGPQQVERLKGSLRTWLREVFLGPHDDAYAQRRRDIGRRHVAVGLPDRYMFTAMQLIEDEVSTLLCTHLSDPWPTLRSLRRVLSLDLALMTGTFLEVREQQQLDTLQRLIVEHLRVVVLLVSEDGTVRSATQATTHMMTGIDVVGRDWREALPIGLVAASSLEKHVERALARHREITLPRVDVDHRSFRIHLVPLRHELASFLIQVEELTDAVEMEARVRRSEALAQLGALSAAVAHELRNPLAGISGALQVITRSMESDGTHHRVLTKVNDEVLRLNNLVTDLLAFARPGSAKLDTVDLRLLADEVTALAKVDHPEVDVTVSGAGTAQADADLVRQILHNILRNALDAVRDMPSPKVRVTVEDRAVQVNDSGPGIPADRAKEVFKPFVTTKARGTGLGLAISTRSAKAMSAKLTLVEGPLSGACFELRWMDDGAQ